MTRMICRIALSLVLAALLGRPTMAQRVVLPGTGAKVAGDDFEDVQWKYNSNGPKSSRNLDKRTRAPLGISDNGLWFESAKRGHPDLIKRVTPPKGGIPGSKGAMLMRTRQSGVPGYTSATSQQDDFLFDTRHGAIPVHMSPNITVRVFLPPFDKWEKSTDTSFGYRAALMATTYEYKRKLFGKRRVAKSELFYPGMFIQFQSKADGHAKDSANFIIRADDYGRDFLGPRITKTGWWTLGMSFTGDGRVHYFAHHGAGRLTARDLIYSSSYGGTRFQSFHTFFFDVISKNDGKSWSTPWIVDDPAVHIGSKPVQTAKGASRQGRSSD
ncbi:MAG: hypothetical protein ACE5KM_00685 [Planctomycetaceae bacterium]